MTSVNNVWSVSYTSGKAFVPSCDFQFLADNKATYVDIKINSGSATHISEKFTNGIYTHENLEIRFSHEKFKTCNFVSIIMTITNKGSSSMKYSIDNCFDTAILGQNTHSASGLPEYRGWRGIYNDKTIDFYFNNSYKVTSATSYHKNNNGAFGKNRSN